MATAFAEVRKILVKKRNKTNDSKKKNTQWKMKHNLIMV